MKYSYSLSLLCSVGFFSLPVSSYWRMACSTVQTGRIDPILDPGLTSGHVHKFAGASNINQYSDFDSLQSTQCSSCEIQDDHSAYWTPQLYYAHSNGTVQEVPNEGMTVYYVGRGGNSSTTVPFPAGFKMLSGNSTVRSYDNATLTYLDTRPVSDRVSFHCIDENNDIPEQHYMFDTNCVNGMRAQINFQSCWDGVNLFLPGNAHVAYLSGIDYGVCPPEYPVSIPGLFFEVLYWTNDIDQSAGGQFVFAQGDTTGYGFHGDVLIGWNMEVQTAAVEQCLYVDDGGVVSACAPLAASDDVNFSRDCLPQPPLNDEPVLGFLTQHPGCNPITSGPEPAPQVICALDSNTPETNSSAETSTVASSSSTTYFTTSLSPTTTPSSTGSTSSTTSFATSSTGFTDSTSGFLTSTTAYTTSYTSFPTSTNDFYSPTTYYASYTTDSVTGYSTMTPTTTPAFIYTSSGITPSSFATSFFAFTQSTALSTSTTFAVETTGGGFYGATNSSTNCTTAFTTTSTDTAAESLITTFVTMTQPFTTNMTITTNATVVPSSLANSTSANTTFLRGRRRAARSPLTRLY